MFQCLFFCVVILRFNTIKILIINEINKFFVLKIKHFLNFFHLKFTNNFWPKHHAFPTIFHRLKSAGTERGRTYMLTKTRGQTPNP